ncbi:hypothetical protein XAC3810_520026 [Xanthomonas citri pv. citri]|uniref:Uncharacterized protein n=1 Tax=Xanthomonas citri pv. citri TaxID=611301 RepID=A0A0U5BVR4_XANCI|nr:hypothetical protein XAC9322_520119 [Xanthomonas citri pv. citri]CEE30720.1 hypothetical protein XAC3824_660120 [Xanthomonas citri pv. citri]CEE32086.1 hypothetical protein XAC1083_510120 [Xanthomonas citri pv. citri]CEE41556.1 hypothetical protein XAC3810_520026 [Xanthomonas citri pv. citri]CEE43573.1 hypothetical protein XAC902_680121 [Xanthomonas citri pv. citri]
MTLGTCSQAIFLFLRGNMAGSQSLATTIDWRRPEVRCALPSVQTTLPSEEGNANATREA